MRVIATHDVQPHKDLSKPSKLHQYVCLALQIRTVKHMMCCLVACEACSIVVPRLTQHLAAQSSTHQSMVQRVTLANMHLNTLNSTIKAQK